MPADPLKEWLLTRFRSARLPLTLNEECPLSAYFKYLPFLTLTVLPLTTYRITISCISNYRCSWLMRYKYYKGVIGRAPRPSQPCTFDHPTLPKPAFLTCGIWLLLTWRAPCPGVENTITTTRRRVPLQANPARPYK